MSILYDQDGKVFGGEWQATASETTLTSIASTGRGHATIAGGTMSWSFIKSLLDESLADENPETGMVTFREAAHVNRGEWKHFGPYHATQGDFSVRMTGTGDADVYVRREMAPTASEYDCRPYVNGSEESCTLQGAGAYYVSVFGYANSEFEFRATFDTTSVETVTDTEETDTKRPTRKRPSRKRPSRKRPSQKRPSQKRPSRKRPSRKSQQSAYI